MSTPTTVNGIDELKDGAIGADAEREGRHRDGRESGVRAQLPRAVAQVLEQCHPDWTRHPREW